MFHFDPGPAKVEDEDNQQDDDICALWEAAVVAYGQTTGDHLSMLSDQEDRTVDSILPLATEKQRILASGGMVTGRSRNFALC